MRAIAVVTLTAAGLAALVTTASAAELGQPYEGCARGQHWNGTRCEWAQPPAAQVRPYYQAPQAYVEEEDDYVAEAPPVYVAPQVYSYSYAVPYYRPPVYGYYAYSRPRYSWGYGGYAYAGGWGGRHHWRH